jgi:cytochrome d ubiquinol oxidase subunit II
LNGRARKVAQWLCPVQLLLTVAGLIATVAIRPGVLDNYKHHAVGFAIPVLVFGALAVMMHGMIKRAGKMAFVASGVYIVGMLIGAAFALYPVVLPASTDPALNLTIYNTAAGAHGLSVGLVWWSLGMVLALG